MQNRINQLFRDLPGMGEQALTTGAWQPATDIFESATAVELMIDLPGVNKNDVQVSIADGQLTINGERKLPHGENRDGYHRLECNYGGFVRGFAIPANIDTTKISAEFREGVLSLTLPKKPEAQPKQIKVN
jgi:HSP20 family protein